jgi:hypothetical protein
MLRMLRMLRIRRLALALLSGAALVAFGSTAAQAVSIPLDCFTNNSVSDCAIAEAQISLEVTDLGGGSLDVTIAAAGSDALSIANVYFDGDILTGITSINDDPTDVEFALGGAPSVLPGGETLSPPFSVDFYVSAADPAPFRGVNPGESLSLTLSIAPGFDFDDVVAALNSGDLRIGMHVIAFESGGSESLVTVPEPGTLLLLGAALLGLTGFGSRRAR